MDALKQFALLLVFLSAAGLVYYFLLPEGRASQTAKSILSVFFLLAAVTPLFSVTAALTPAISAEREASPGGYEDVFLEAAKSAIGKEIDKTVKKYTDAPYGISVSAHIEKDNSIEIEQVTILFDTAQPDLSELTAALREALGFTPVLTVREGE